MRLLILLWVSLQHGASAFAPPLAHRLPSTLRLSGDSEVPQPVAVETKSPAVKKKDKKDKKKKNDIIKTDLKPTVEDSVEAVEEVDPQAIFDAAQMRVAIEMAQSR